MITDKKFIINMQPVGLRNNLQGGAFKKAIWTATVSTLNWYDIVSTYKVLRKGYNPTESRRIIIEGIMGGHIYRRDLWRDWIERF